MAAQSIFVSHSHADNDFGIRLVQDVRDAVGDYDAVWFDAAGGLHGGDTWWRKIVDEITARPAFVVILSPDALNSPWVKDEINLAWKLKNTTGKRIIPVLHRPCDVWQDLQTLHIVSFASPKPYEASLAELLTSLGVPLPARLRSVAPPPPVQAVQVSAPSVIGNQSVGPNTAGRESVRNVLTPPYVGQVLARVGASQSDTEALIRALPSLPFGTLPTPPRSAGPTTTRVREREYPAAYSDMIVAVCTALCKLNCRFSAVSDVSTGAVIQAVWPMPWRSGQARVTLEIAGTATSSRVSCAVAQRGSLGVADWCEQRLNDVFRAIEFYYLPQQ